MLAKTKTIIAICIALFTLLFLLGCASNPQTAETIKIGFSGPLTGEIANWGQNDLAGATLAVKEINEQGGINGKKVELIVEDDKSASADSVTAFNKLINVDKVIGIIAGGGSGATSPAVPIAQNDGVPVVVAVASAPNITKTGDFIFRVMPMDNFQGKFAAEFIFEKLEKKKAAILYVKNDWGEGLKDIFKQSFLDLGGEITYESGLLQTDNDFKTEIAKIKDSGADVLYCPIYPDAAVTAFKQIKEAELNLPIVCGDAIDGSEVIKSDSAEGIIYTTSKINLPEQFRQKIVSQKGFENLQVFIAAPLGYDATKALLLAIEKAGTDKKAISDELAKTNFAGVSNPTIQFDENREIKNPVFEAKIIKNKEAIAYGP